MSEKTGFTYTEIMAMQSHIAISLFHAKQEIAEQRNKEEEKQNKNYMGGMDPSQMTPQHMMSQAKQFMPAGAKIPSSIPGMGSIPSMGSFKTGM